MSLVPYWSYVWLDRTTMPDSKRNAISVGLLPSTRFIVLPGRDFFAEGALGLLPCWVALATADTRSGLDRLLDKLNSKAAAPTAVNWRWATGRTNVLGGLYYLVDIHATIERRAENGDAAEAWR